VYLSQATDLRLILPELVAVSAVIVCLLLSLCYLNSVPSLVLPSALRSRRLIVALLLLSALLVRLLFLVRPAELSDDLYRYVWDGLQLLHGHNPYALSPQDVVANNAALLQLQPLINHPSLVTIYPPAAQILFALSGGTLLGWKLLLLVLDLGSCLVLAQLLIRLGRNPWWLSLYALHPLVVLEGAASAHVDSAAVFFVLLGVLLVDLSRGSKIRWCHWPSVLAALCLAVAVMIKLFPLLVLPFVYLFVPSRQRMLFIGVFVLSCAALVVPFLPQIANALGTLQLYACNWEFSSFVFRLLRSMLHSGSQSRLILLLIFCCNVAILWWRLNRADIDLARLVRSLSCVLLLFLLLTPTLHPWYALYLTALLPLAATPATIAICWSVLLSYQVVAVCHFSGVWQESSMLSFYIFVAPVAASLLTATSFFWSGRRQGQ